MRYFFAVINEYPFVAFCVAIFIMIMADRAIAYLSLQVLLIANRIELLDKQKNQDK